MKCDDCLSEINPLKTIARGSVMLCIFVLLLVFNVMYNTDFTWKVITGILLVVFTAASIKLIYQQANRRSMYDKGLR